MLKFSIPALFALTTALAVGPAMAAPQFAGTNTIPGNGGDFNVDCSDQQYRNLPFCQMQNNQAATKVAPRINALSCPSDDLVLAGKDRDGNRLYRCNTISPNTTTKRNPVSLSN